MGLFGLFASKAERKKRECGKALAAVEAQLQDVQDRIAVAKRGIQRDEYSIKLKLAEYEHATDDVKEQIRKELDILQEQGERARRRLDELTDLAGTLARQRDDLLDAMANPKEEEIAIRD